VKLSQILRKHASLKFSEERTYLFIPYSEKDFAKSHGARWDMDQRQWYVRGEVPEELKKFLTKGREVEGDRTYLFIPFEAKDEAKRNGARWDSDKKQWYVVGEVPSALQDYLTKKKVVRVPKGERDGKFRVCWWVTNQFGKQYKVCNLYKTEAEMDKAYEIAKTHKSKSSVTRQTWTPDPVDEHGRRVDHSDSGGYFDNWSGSWLYRANY